MRRISDKAQDAINTILWLRDSDEIAYAYYRICKLVKSGCIDDLVTREGEEYIKRANEL